MCNHNEVNSPPPARTDLQCVEIWWPDSHLENLIFLLLYDYYERGLIHRQTHKNPLPSIHLRGNAFLGQYFEWDLAEDAMRLAQERSSFDLVSF